MNLITTIDIKIAIGSDFMDVSLNPNPENQWILFDGNWNDQGLWDDNGDWND